MGNQARAAVLPWLALVMLIHLSAGAAECGPATYTNPGDTTLEVGVQLGEGYEEVTLGPGTTVEFWEAAPGSHWGIWNLATGDVLAAGVQCGEPVVIEDPVVDYDPVLDAPAPEPVPEPTPLPIGVAIV